MRIVLDRLMLVCPHPDDETLGAGLLLQEAARCGAEIRIIYLTEGERIRFRSSLPRVAGLAWPPIVSAGACVGVSRHAER